MTGNIFYLLGLLSYLTYVLYKIACVIRVVENVVWRHT